MSPALTLTLYCLALVAVSLAGGWLPMLVRLTHRRLELALSFVSGVMMGVALLMLLPHAFQMRLEAGDSLAADPGGTVRRVLGGPEAHELGHDLLSPVMLWLLAGFLVMFFIERFFCFHHHEPTADADAGAPRACAHDHPAGHDDHPNGEEHGPARARSHAAHAITWSGAAVGLALHSLLDGVALAASVSVAHADDGEPGGGVDGSLVAGLGTFLVVLLHKPFDSLTLGTLLAAGTHARSTRHLVNVAFALLAPLGAGLFLLGLTAGDSQHAILSAALAFAAGTFLCIAMSDLLPELQFHQHDRITLSAALMLGLALAWLLATLEAGAHAQ